MGIQTIVNIGVLVLLVLIDYLVVIPNWIVNPLFQLNLILLCVVDKPFPLLSMKEQIDEL